MRSIAAMFPSSRSLTEGPLPSHGKGIFLKGGALRRMETFGVFQGCAPRAIKKSQIDPTLPRYASVGWKISWGTDVGKAH